MMQRFAALALSLFLAATAHAAAPQIIPLQGVLTDAGGTPISTAVVVQFYLYPAQTGGSALWTETQTITPQDGLFVAYLGSQTAVPLTVFRDNSTLYLAIKVGTDAEMPRILLGTTPYAGFAQYCGSVGTVDVGALPDAVPVGPLTCGSQVVTGIDATGNLTCAADKDTLGGLTCSGNQVPKWNGSAWACASLVPQVQVTSFTSGSLTLGGWVCTGVTAGTPCSSGVAVGGSCSFNVTSGTAWVAVAGSALNTGSNVWTCNMCNVTNVISVTGTLTVQTNCVTVAAQ